MLPVTRFATVPGGWFLMGSEEGQDDESPVHRVWVDTFELAIYPVTRGEYANFRHETNYAPPREWDNPRFADPLLPVIGVSWHDAYVYCVWRSSLGDLVRLPTEAEWERAARNGDGTSRYPWGDEIPAWIPNRGIGALESPWPVAFGDPTALGLYGIGANIHEWCADWHSKAYYQNSPSRNPVGPTHGVRRASRGGSWRHARTLSRNAARSKLDPSFRYTDYGFRLARSLADPTRG